VLFKNKDMNHAHHHHHRVEHKENQPSHAKLAVSATVHCLIGCGLGEVAGMIIGTALSFNNTNTIILAVILGFVFGFILGMRPLLKAGFTFKKAFRQVLIAEGLSIVVMETAEVLIEVFIPGVMQAHIHEPIFWIGMLLALIAGFLAAYPVNYYMIKRGIKHQH
jgi:putative flippase GtrA